jgi:hypothetical protein
VLAKTTGTAASSLVDGVVSSLISLCSRLPRLSLYGSGTPSPTPNPSPLAPTDGPTASGEPNEEEQGMHAQLDEEPNVPWTSDGRLPNFQPGEGVFIVGGTTDPGDSEVNNDEPEESTIVRRDDIETSNDGPEESTTVRRDDTSNDEPEESTIVRTDDIGTSNNEPEEGTIVQRYDIETNNDELEEGTIVRRDDTSNDEPEESTTVRRDDTETNNNEPEESTIVRTDDTEIYTNELKESALVWSNERAKVLLSFDLFPIFHSEELF